MQSIANKVVAGIYGHGRGWAFSLKDFQGLGTPEAIGMALSRLRRKGTIRSVCHGIYDYPGYSTFLEAPLDPDLDQVARAIARRHNWRIQPSGSTALNILGLSNQVPAQVVYLSDGPTKSFEIGSRTLHFNKKALKEFGFKLKESGLVVQSLKELGKERADRALRKKLLKAVPAAKWKKIVKDTRSVSVWVHEVIRQCSLEAEA